MGDIQDIRRSAASAANSASSSARSNATTARAAQNAATGVWVGAGFQAVNMIQGARAAKAQQEQLELQQAMAEQEQIHHFAMWRQTGDGVAFLRWREQAHLLAQFIRDRDSLWLQGWAAAIGRAQMETSIEEKLRFTQYPGRLKQVGLGVVAIVSLVFAGFAGLGVLIQWALMSMSASYQYGYERETDSSPFTIAIIWFVLLLALAIGFLVLRIVKRRAARADQTVARETQGRIARWGFDPLSVKPGYFGFSWYVSENFNGYADRLMSLVLHGHTQHPDQSRLIRLVDPEPWQPHANHPPEVNEMLAWFQTDRPAINQARNSADSSPLSNHS